MTLLDDRLVSRLLSRSAARRERRRLAAIDRAAARLALLASTRETLVTADSVVAGGWLQDGWFAIRDDDGREWEVGSPAAHAVQLSSVTRACLVGALVVGAGGADRPAVRTSVEAIWHTLRHDVDRPIDWIRSPETGAMHIRELTTWNDRPGRTPAEVRAVLASAGTLVAAELDRVRVGHLEGGAQNTL